MKTLATLFIGLMLSAVPAQAIHLGEALEMLKLDNEQIMAKSGDDRFAAQVVADLEAGKKVSEADLKRAYKYCADALAQIETTKLRKKALKEIMAEVDKDLEAWAWKGGSNDRYHRARMKSDEVRRKFRSLLEFQAERYRRFLKVLVDDC